MSTNSVAYTYDADGNLTQRVDNTGTTKWVYDALNRVTKEELPSGSDACSGSSPAGITYGYDTASNLTSMCNAQGTTSYTYDALTRSDPGGAGWNRRLHHQPAESDYRLHGFPTTPVAAAP